MAIAGPSDIATEAASLAVAEGGSVVDVAIVAALVASCTEPGVCAPGGGGFLTIDLPSRRPVVIDGYMTYPGIGFSGEVVAPQVWMEYGGGVTTAVGPGSIGVPGTFAALGAAHAQFGSAPWAMLMEIAASSIEAGFPLSQASHNYLVYSGEPIFSVDPASRAAIYDGDRLKDVGDTVLYEGLAETLRHIGSEGAEVMYRGDLAQAIVEDLSMRGSDITRQDLAVYEPVVRDPLRLRAERWDVSANPPPAVGGVTFALAMAELAGQDDPGPADWASALVSAFSQRAAELQPGEGFEDDAVRLLRRAGVLSPSTIAVAVVDESGGAVSASFSGGYGSGVIPAGTGMLMNNGVGELELGGKEAGVAGSRLMSNMTPLVARAGGDVVALGTPGASRITSALVSTVAALALGDDLMGAIEHPRVHPEFGDWGVRVAVEPGISADFDWDVRRYEELHMYFGGVNGAAFQGGVLHGHADSRRTGSTVITP